MIGRRGSSIFGEMTAETGIDYDLLLALGLCEFYEEDFGGEVVDVGDAEGEEGVGELVSDDLEGDVSGSLGRFPHVDGGSS